MLTYWFPAPVSYWWPLTFALVFAALAVFAVYMTLTRREEEQDAGTIAALYAVGLGVAAVSEFLMYLNVAFGWSLATVFAVSTGVVTFFAIAAVVITILAIGIAVAMQIREEGSYRAAHG
ncbi:MAG TPA: hypothetical protein VFU88_06240 [Ktedonobacterales bacterium]|nr:hypothetical protein [Ktedonobacterales bacterium]